MLIELAAVLLMAFHGRIFGATGILSGLMHGGDMRVWSLRAALLAGMVLAPGLVLLVTGNWPALDGLVSMTAIIGGGGWWDSASATAAAAPRAMASAAMPGFLTARSRQRSASWPPPSSPSMSPVA